MALSLDRLESGQRHERAPSLEVADAIVDSFATQLSDKIFSVVMGQLPRRLRSPFYSSTIRFEWDLNLTWEKGVNTLQKLIPEFEDWEPFYEWSQIHPKMHPLDDGHRPVCETMNRVCDRTRQKLLPLFELFQKNNPRIEFEVISPECGSHFTYSTYVDSGTLRIELWQEELPKEAIHSSDGAIAAFHVRQQRLRLQEKARAVAMVALTVIFFGLIRMLKYTG